MIAITVSAAVLCLLGGVLLGLFLSCLHRYTWPVVLHLLRPGVSWKKINKSGEAWAVITGSSDSLGRDYARLLAEKGFNVFLISRTLSKLQAVASDIEATYGRQTKVLSLDFTDASDRVYDQISAELEGLDVAVLVNNIGVNQDHPDFVTNVSRATHRNIINGTLFSTVEMCRMLAHDIASRDTGGVIINVSSVGGLCPVPLLNTYSCVKRAVVDFSRALQTEYNGTGLTIQCVCPGVFVSAMSKVRKPNAMAVLPIVVARNSLAAVGKSTVFVPAMKHSITWFLMDVMPYQIQQAATKAANMKVRAKAQAKAERAAARATEGAEQSSSNALNDKLIP